MTFARRRRQARGPRVGALLALVVAVAASVLGPAGTASAAAGPTPKPAARTSEAAPTPPRTSEAAPKPSKATDSHLLAARQIAAGIGEGSDADTCSGSLTPGAVHTCSALPAGGAGFTLDVPRAGDLVFVQVVDAQGYPADVSLTAPDGTAVTCDQPDGSYGVRRCPTRQAGDHTLRVTSFWSTGGAFSVAYKALLSDSTCTAVTEDDTALGAPAVLPGGLAAGSAGVCYTLPTAAGETLRLHLAHWPVHATVYDAAGTPVCDTRTADTTDLDCALKGEAPFRVLANERSGAADDSNTVTLARLSHPAGCPAVEPQAYGTVPDTASSARCRILRVRTAGPHLFGALGADGTTDTPIAGRLHRADGTPVCVLDPSTPCGLTAGDYTWARDGRSGTGTDAYGVWFYPTSQTQGCTPVRDDGFASGPASGTFTGPGQTLCLGLPTGSSRGVYLVDQGTSDDVHPAVRVFDAAGTAQCADNGAPTVCKLTGTAPFHAVLSAPSAGTYRLAVQRTGEAAGCTAWAQSAFGDHFGAQVALRPGQTACLSLAADAHSTAELLDYTNDSNRVTAALRIHDTAGDQVCATVGSSTTTCRFTGGAAYTVLLTNNGYAADTYKLVRRDISATARCAAPRSLAVGGPSTAYTFHGALDSTCLRVTAAATDKLWLSVRAPDAAYRTGATLGVVDGSGTVLCRAPGTAGTCRVSGSASYLVFALANGYATTPITAYLDTWRIGTAAGWAPECTANTVSPAGFAPRSGVLTESATAYCAVLSMKPNLSFDVYGADSSVGTDMPSLSLLAPNAFGATTDYSYQCSGSYGEFRFHCLTSASAPSGQYVLLLGPGDAAAPYEYTMQGVCKSGCGTYPPRADVSRLSSTSGPAGTAHPVVLYGSGLTLGTEIELRNSDTGSGYRMNPPVSVGPDGTSLTVLLGTRDLPPGRYDLVADSPGYTSGTRSPGYLPDAYTVTQAAATTPGRFVPVTPQRFLDTRSGIGAPKARVGAGGTVKLKVAGVGGIPATGVTAVVMNVTAVAPTSNGFLTVHPDGRPVPSASSLNYTAGRTLSNLVTVAVSNGTVDLRNSAGTVDIVADVAGYYTAAQDTGSVLTPIDPTRFLDTRSGIGAPKARVGAGGTVKLKVAGVRGVPATGVTAVVMNVTAVAPTANGFVTVYPDGQAVPTASNINYTAGQTLPNLVVVPVVNGSVALRNSAGAVDLLADVTGYYSAQGAAFTAADPVRLLDTRSGLGARAGAVGTGGVVSMQVTGVAGVPAEGVTAVVLNVTVTAPTADSFLIVHPHGRPRPVVSNLNYTAGKTISNLVVVPVVDGRITFTNHTGGVQVVADLNGWFGG
ncbi:MULTISPECIES: hypothetical protein [unclassified Streptomyces]|uniref:hypothetical protein n=1 Tax=unclassified Streptomyces TaxID=2593676 RepID=UPI0036FF5743